jgi:hypothetical protein
VTAHRTLDPRNWHFEMPIPGVPDCPIDTYCEDIEGTVNGVVVKTTKCTPFSKSGVSQTRKQNTDPQAGSSVNKEAPKGLATATMYHQLTIADDMMASVSAFILSEFLALWHRDWC